MNSIKQIDKDNKKSISVLVVDEHKMVFEAANEIMNFNSNVKLNMHLETTVRSGEKYFAEHSNVDVVIYGYGNVISSSNFGDSSGFPAYVKKINPNTPVIAWSGDSGKRIVAKEQGADDFVFKEPSDAKHNNLKTTILNYVK